jgi:hypothetical protein
MRVRWALGWLFCCGPPAGRWGRCGTPPVAAAVAVVGARACYRAGLAGGVSGPDCPSLGGHTSPHLHRKGVTDCQREMRHGLTSPGAGIPLGLRRAANLLCVLFQPFAIGFRFSLALALVFELLGAFGDRERRSFLFREEFRLRGVVRDGVL